MRTSVSEARRSQHGSDLVVQSYGEWLAGIRPETGSRNGIADACGDGSAADVAGVREENVLNER